jgi:hypothetical protein
MVQNRIHIETSYAIHIVGFFAIFIEANYLIGDWSNAVFHRELCLVMLQRLAI